MLKFCQKQIFIPSILKISDNEIGNTGKYLKEEGFNHAAIFFSEGIEDLFGEKLRNSLATAKVEAVHTDIISNIDIENIVHNAFKIPKSADVLVGIGGGKALDYAKYCAHILALPFVSIPTSVSNDGFCSPNSSLIVDGRRQSITAKIPYGVIVDIDALKTSPEFGIYSGIGDLISKITAGYDWKLAAKTTGERFNDFAHVIANNSVSDILHYKGYGIRNPEFLFHLANSLLMSGISMEIAGVSRPASGSEHLISHALDKIAKTPAMHGIQVGVATYVCSYVQQNRFEVVKDFLESTGFFDFVVQKPLDKEDFLTAIEIARTIKEDFYTVLSEKRNIEKAKEFVLSDEICKRMLK